MAYFSKTYNPSQADLSAVLASVAPNVPTGYIFNSDGSVTISFAGPDAGLPRAAVGSLTALQLHSPQPEKGLRT